MTTQRKVRLRGLRAALISAALVLGLMLSGLACGAGGQTATHAPLSDFPQNPGAGAGSGHWLGLDYNSSSGRGGIHDFASRGIVYDRGGALEVRAGRTIENWPRLAQGLRESLAAGMVPDVYVNAAVGPVGCQGDPNGHTKLCLPVSTYAIQAYVQGFIATASSVLRAYPHRRVLFEPMNEPWGWGFPPGTPPSDVAAREYATVLARLLPACRAAGIPLDDIYVAATGRLADGSSWIPDLYAAQPCLKPGPGTCGPIEGWNAHPYGLPGSSSEGIGVLPAEHAEMLSGRNNVIVSEVGFCATDVSSGLDCNENRPDIVGPSSQTRRWLTETLQEALAMHRAGWLRALLVWSRANGGWAMQNKDGTLTPAGEALVRFAESHQ